MTNSTEPGAAQAALAEIERRQAEVIQGALVPAWYWWAVALPMVGLGVVVDTRQALAIGAAAIVFGGWVALLTIWMVLGGQGRVTISEGILGARGAGLIMLFVGALVVGTLALAFALEASNSAYPATIATLACAVALVLGGPWLMRRLRVTMHERPGAAR